VDEQSHPLEIYTPKEPGYPALLVMRDRSKRRGLGKAFIVGESWDITELEALAQELRDDPEFAQLVLDDPLLNAP
jgi:hypothetical protein